jgi:hypothetical protein
VVQASVWEDAEGLVRKVTLLEGELAEARQAREVAEENSAACPTRCLMACGG